MSATKISFWWALHRNHMFTTLQLPKALVGTLKLEQSVILPRPVLVGHSYLQYAGAAYKCFKSLRYYFYFSPSTHNVHDGVLFAYEDSMKAGAYVFSLTIPQFSLNLKRIEVVDLVENKFNRIASEVLSE